MKSIVKPIMEIPLSVHSVPIEEPVPVMFFQDRCVLCGKAPSSVYFKKIPSERVTIRSTEISYKATRIEYGYRKGIIIGFPLCMAHKSIMEASAIGLRVLARLFAGLLISLLMVILFFGVANLVALFTDEEIYILFSACLTMPVALAVSVLTLIGIDKRRASQGKVPYFFNPFNTQLYYEVSSEGKHTVRYSYKCVISILNEDVASGESPQFEKSGTTATTTTTLADVLGYGSDVKGVDALRSIVVDTSVPANIESARCPAYSEAETRNEMEQDLLQAAEYGDVDRVKALLDSGVYVDAVDQEKSTALGNAAVGGYVKVMEVLLDRGANVNAQNKDGITPLMRASGNGHIEAIKLLLARGADLHIVDREGLTALQYAEMLGRREIAQILREQMNL